MSHHAAAGARSRRQLTFHSDLATAPAAAPLVVPVLVKLSFTIGAMIRRRRSAPAADIARPASVRRRADLRD